MSAQARPVFNFVRRAKLTNPRHAPRVEPLEVPEPVELGADQPVVALGAHRPALLAPTLVHRLVGVLGDVELVEHDLAVRVRQMSPG